MSDSSHPLQGFNLVRTRSLGKDDPLDYLYARNSHSLANTTRKIAQPRPDFIDKLLSQTHGRLHDYTSSNVQDIPDIRQVGIGTKLSVLCKETMQWSNCSVQKKKHTGSTIEVCVISEDGDEKVFKDFMGEEWRIVTTSSLRPRMTKVYLNYYSRPRFSITKLMEIMNSTESAKKWGTVSFPISPEDFGSLQADQQISDAVIDSFSKTLLKENENKTGDRILYLPPSLMNICKNDEDNFEILERACDTLQLYDIDCIIWPFTLDGHWCLTIGIVDSMDILFVDPYTPYNGSRGYYYTTTVRDRILRAYNNMWEPYFQKFKIPDGRKWVMKENGSELELLNFPALPAKNVVDSGVCVSMYIWAVMVGESIHDKMVPNAIDVRNMFFVEFRTTIGHVIWGQH